MGIDQKIGGLWKRIMGSYAETGNYLHTVFSRYHVVEWRGKPGEAVETLEFDFDSEADIWDVISKQTGNSSDGRRIRYVCRAMQPEYNKFLEIGIGDGKKVLRYMRGIGKSPENVYGTDISDNMLAVAERNGIPGGHLANHDMTKGMPRQFGNMDVIFAVSGVIGYVPNNADDPLNSYVKFVDDAYDLLNEKGMLVLEVICNPADDSMDIMRYYRSIFSKKWGALPEKGEGKSREVLLNTQAHEIYRFTREAMNAIAGNSRFGQARMQQYFTHADGASPRMILILQK